MSSVEDNRKSGRQFWFQRRKQMTTMMRRKKKTIPELSPAIDGMEKLGNRIIYF